MVMGNGNEIYLTVQQGNKTSVWERQEEQPPFLKVTFITFKIIKQYLIHTEYI